MFNFPITSAAHTQAYAELFNSRFIELSEEEKAFSMRPFLQVSVLADMQSTGSGLRNRVFSSILILSMKVLSLTRPGRV